MNSRTEATAAEERIVCPCFGSTEADIRERLSKPGATFEDLVDDTGIGSKCTACLLDVDLVLQDYVDTHAYHIPKKDKVPNVRLGWMAKENARGVGGGWALTANPPNIGFFLNHDGVTTTLRIPNRRLLFDRDAPISSYDYRIIVRGPDGKRAAFLEGELRANDDLVVDFSRINDCPAHGWFLSCLYARDDALRGTTRPQVLYRGEKWASTVHPQTFQGASYKRSLLNAFTKGGTPLIMAINVVKKPSRLSVSANYLREDGGQTKSIQLPSYGAKLIDFRETFDELDDEKDLWLTIESDTPVQKFILNKQSSGALDIDHFPDR